MRKVLKGLGIGLGVLILVLALLVAYWYLRPNKANVSSDLYGETWVAVDDGAHNSNTDMIYWQDAFYLIYASSPFHFASKDSRLHIVRSEDARNWRQVAEFDAAGEDIRDPKFAPIGDRLFLYALKNTDFAAEPYQTVYAVSEDGLSWSPFQEIEPKGWLFWRPKTQDGLTWYAPAYWHGHGRAALLRSQNGVDWTIESEIHEGDRSDEPAIEFLPDGRLLATVRLEMSDSLAGHPEGSTLITTSEPPFESWAPGTRSKVARLDGPALFNYNGRVYAVGRYQPHVAGPFGWQGSIFSRKRTSLYRVEEDGLVHLSDLPSAGDTSYAGLVRRGENLYVSYYTSDVHRDVPWILGMVSPSAIRMARISLPSLEALAETIAGE